MVRLTRVFFAKLLILRVKMVSARGCSRPFIAIARASIILPQRAVLMEVITPHSVSKRRIELPALEPSISALFSRAVRSAVSVACFAVAVFAADHALNTSVASRRYRSKVRTSVCENGSFSSLIASPSSSASSAPSSAPSAKTAAAAPAIIVKNGGTAFRGRAHW